jgi:hypothetical protein
MRGREIEIAKTGKCMKTVILNWLPLRAMGADSHWDPGKNSSDYT